MNYRSLQVQASERLERSCSDGEQSDMLKSTTTAKKSLHKESKTVSLTKPLSSAISGHSSMKGLPQVIRAWLMSSLQDSPVSPSVLPVNDSERMIQGICGRQQLNVFASYDHDSHSWRMSQGCLLTLTQEEFSETWPKAGMMRNGVCYRQPKWERRIREIGSGLWPTPTVDDADNSTLPPSQRERDNLPGALLKNGEASGGQLNPDWVEALMGWPPSWTSLYPMSKEIFNRWLKTHQWEDWEPDIPRVVTGASDRVNRLKALGNGQVPEVVATAWRLLNEY